MGESINPAIKRRALAVSLDIKPPVLWFNASSTQARNNTGLIIHDNS